MDEREINFAVAENGTGKAEAMKALRDEINGVFKKMGDDVRYVAPLLILITVHTLQH